MPAKILYEISNPSDPYTIAPESFLPGAIGVLLVGNGAYGMKPIDAGADTESLPIFILGGAREWVKEKTGSDLDDWLRVPANARAVADALDTVLIGNKRDREELEEALALMPEGLERTAYIAGWKDRRRSSLNNIGAAAANLVLGLRALADEQEAGAAA